jgi:hypothetical protein
VQAGAALGLDHTGITVDDLEKAKKMYLPALQPLNYKVQKDLTPSYPVIGLGAPSDLHVPSFWLAQSKPFTSLWIAFSNLEILHQLSRHLSDNLNR